MDGYAVAGDRPWRVIGESAAGRPFAGSVGTREAIRISTGALMPAGGEAVLLLSVDSPVPAPVIEQARKLPGVKRVMALAF